MEKFNRKGNGSIAWIFRPITADDDAYLAAQRIGRNRWDIFLEVSSTDFAVQLRANCTGKELKEIWRR